MGRPSSYKPLAMPFQSPSANGCMLQDPCEFGSACLDVMIKFCLGFG
jgi:hypothetical protein